MGAPNTTTTTTTTTTTAAAAAATTIAAATAAAAAATAAATAAAAATTCSHKPGCPSASALCLVSRHLHDFSPTTAQLSVESDTMLTLLKGDWDEEDLIDRP